MKKNTYRIPITVMIPVIIFAFLTGCASRQQSESHTTQTSTQKTTQMETKETKQTELRETEQETLTGYTVAFKAVIDNTLKECKEKYPNEANHGQYGLYDFDNDSIPELFLEVYGSTTPDHYIHIYNFDGNKAVCIDSIQSSHSQVYGTNRENAFLVESVWMGVSAWNIYELKNGEFISDELASYYPDGFGGSIEPEENPLSGKGYEIKEIEYYELDDLSGVSSSEELKNDNY